MSIFSVPIKSIHLPDYDFSVDRPKVANTNSHDGTITIRMPGTNRKSANHELIFLPYFKKHNLKFKTVAIGISKKKTKPSVVVFDNDTLAQDSATIRKYQKITGIVNSKSHALKILKIFKLAVPARADEVVKVYFSLHPTVVPRNKLNYRICTISLIKIIKDGHTKEAGTPKRKKLKPMPVTEFLSLKDEDKEKNTSSNIL